ncbi:E3 ubiquitin- ligase RFWD3 [Olea europaea subsp. europaea]|uniref:RING-type E3 ubiquitin transferase n=1 Tax=Olea europaea subsp. europaea TaxID=158383 RepID=A0A8S0V870_OLEEU|nr:E3 ubiquitin- ligase RFWD3 [Olea europaea subsp. europaea]
MADPDYLAYLSFLTERRISPSGLSEYLHAEDGDDEMDIDFIGMPPSDGPNSASVARSSQESVDIDDSAVESDNVVVVEDEDEDGSNERRNYNNSEGGEMSSSKDNKDEEEKVDAEEELNRDEIDGLICPICFEAWSSGGDHRVCCLPCGHIYGLACIKKWLQGRGSGKCPQCKKKCSMKSIRVLYASRIVALDVKLQKKVRSLEAKCSSFKEKSDDLSAKRVEWRKKEADLCMEVHYLKERTRHLEGLLESAQSRPLGSSMARWGCRGEAGLGDDVEQEFHQQGSSISFMLQKDIQVDGARIFDVDTSSQILIIARRLSGMGTMNVLTKMSLIPSHEKEDIHLPVGFKAVKDLRVSPHARIVLLASLGKKLSVVSTQSNNTVLTYDLQAAAWSCSWDLSNSHYIYAGLQNGMVVQFDMRQTMRPVESITGLTDSPIHTVHSLSADSTVSCGVKGVLTASSVGLCHWDFGRSGGRPYLIPESENQGVCISLAYGPSRDDIVASFRPKIEFSGDLTISQPTLSASTSISGEGVRGSHVLYKRVGGRYEKLGATCANVSGIRLPKSAIVDGVSQNPLFASADEVTSELDYLAAWPRIHCNYSQLNSSEVQVGI